LNNLLENEQNHAPLQETVKNLLDKSDFKLLIVDKLFQKKRDLSEVSLVENRKQKDDHLQKKTFCP
jgi:hypothetical protein